MAAARLSSVQVVEEHRKNYVDNSIGPFRDEEEAQLPCGGDRKPEPRDGKAVEVLGHYNPVAQPTELKLNQERVAYWMQNGAQPSDTVKRLIKNAAAAEPVATA